MTGPSQPITAPVLAVETSSRSGSVALARAGVVLGAGTISGSRRHAVELLPTIARLCETHAVRPAEIRGVFVSAGPGSFTGLRVGITAARMLAMAVDAELVAVPTLDVIAQNALDAADAPDRVAVLLDAKRSRVYAAIFKRQPDRYVALTEPQEVEPKQFLMEQAGGGVMAVMGEGVAYQREAVEATGLAIMDEALNQPRAETVFHLGLERAKKGALVDRRMLVPTYIRPPEAEEKWLQRHPPEMRSP